MAVHQASKWCGGCRRRTLHVKHTFGVGMGLLLTVLTAGLFIPVWIVIIALEGFGAKWRCQACGKAKLL
jgi:hypothetical protein